MVSSFTRGGPDDRDSNVNMYQIASVLPFRWAAPPQPTEGSERGSSLPWGLWITYKLQSKSRVKPAKPSFFFFSYHLFCTMVCLLLACWVHFLFLTTTVAGQGAHLYYFCPSTRSMLTCL